MSDAKVQTKQITKVIGYSSCYHAIRKEATSKWPAWKVTVYNASVATSNHAKKVEK